MIAEMALSPSFTLEMLKKVIYYNTNTGNLYAAYENVSSQRYIKTTILYRCFSLNS